MFLFFTFSFLNFLIKFKERWRKLFFKKYHLMVLMLAMNTKKAEKSVLFALILKTDALNELGRIGV
jgi:hypothetical protein